MKTILVSTMVGMLALQNGGVVTATVEGYGRGYALHLAYFEAEQTMPKAETWSQQLPGLPVRTTITGCDTTVHVMAEFEKQTSVYSWSWAPASAVYLPLVCSP